MLQSTIVHAQMSLEYVGSTGRPARISFENVSLPDDGITSAYANNPIICGDNLYAPDMVRTATGWNCYYGGWKTLGQAYDRTYLGTTQGREVNTSWTEQMIISEGSYRHVNDPTVVIENGTWIMLYTAADFVGSGPTYRYRDWINYSTSTDGVNWTPNAGTSSTEISMTDPLNILNGAEFSDIARPSLVLDGAKWKLWFDAKINSGPIDSYLAESSEEFPSAFQLVHAYPNLGSFPAFMEPDVVRRPDGTFIAVIQRGFKQLHYGTSTDGVHFDLKKVVDADDPFFGRKWLSNPGLIYDQEADEVLGFAFGMTDNDAYMDHDIGFAAMHLQVSVKSPGNVWHLFTEAHRLDEISLRVFQYTSFENVLIKNPATGQSLVDQPFMQADVGDLWRLVDTSSIRQWNEYEASPGPSRRDFDFN